MKNKVTLVVISILTFVGIIGCWYFFSSKVHQALTFDMTTLGDKDNVVPVAIIGSGPAGLSAAIYTARANLHTVIFEGKKPGGQLTETSDVENWPGMGKQLGPTIINQLKQQAATFHANFVWDSITKVDFSHWPFTLLTEEGTEIHALAVIMATGANPRLLSIPGEKEYWGKGVTTCAICDAPFYKDKEVVVIGGGDSAAEEALQLASHAKTITLLVRSEHMRASHAMQERLKVYPHIKIRYKTQVTEIKGNGSHVTGVQLKTDSSSELLPIEGIFLAIGHIPNTQIVQNALQLDSNGYIVLTPFSQKTSVEGVFSAGDASDHTYRQAGVASGDGIKAALDATNFLVHIGFNDVFAEKLESQFFQPTLSASQEILKITDEAHFEKEVTLSKLPVIVDFYTPQCPSCLQMMPYVAELSAKFGQKIKFVKVDGAELPQLMKRFIVTSVPTFLVFQEGILIGRSTAAMTRRELREFAQKFI